MRRVPFPEILDKAEDIAQNHFCVVFPSFLGRTDSLGMGERLDTLGVYMWRIYPVCDSLKGSSISLATSLLSL